MGFKKFIIIIIASIAINVSCAQTLQTVKNEAFKAGEVLKYHFYYDAWLTGRITAGTGIVEVKNTNKTFYGREVFHIDTEGRSKGLFNWFFKVHDKFDSYIDKEALIPYLFIRRTREGGYVKDDDVYFNQFEHYVISRTDSMQIPPNVQDIISAFYYSRTLDFSNLKVDDYLPINFFLDDSVYTSVIIYEGIEEIEISLGKFRCLKFKPMMAKGEVFSNTYPMSMWITDDKNHIPILAKSAIIVGSVKMELTKFSGLANPLSSKIE
ncbi:MAG: DUF3108 domain-containing protein [Bacteroidales bacterium]|nr:DUF3108 domain-containing protein [Bacteroidales bacterium]